MKAWVVARQGDPADALVLRTDIKQPTKPAASNVIVKIAYAALNPADINFVKWIPTLLPFRRQPIPGLDFSGRITAIGSQVPSHLKVDDEVCGVIPVSQVARGTGTLVEYLEVSYDVVVRKPNDLSLQGSAAMGIVMQTALLMLKSRPANAGDRVIVHGASGGMGTVLVQLASAAGAHVVGVCSGANADMIVDYTESESLADLIHSKHPEQFDTLYNCVGGSPLCHSSAKFLKPDGAYVDIAGPGGPVFSYWRTFSTHWLPRILGGSSGPKYKTVNLAPSGSLQEEAVMLFNDGFVREIIIDSKYPFDQALEAFARLETKRAKGKVLIEF
ncbi:Zinc alcohol dehydrogenase [Paramyrothecium foliicola]|nr:Zinc alcohol dehydrogenase [Paramyrothecium foliicola]